MSSPAYSLKYFMVVSFMGEENLSLNFPLCCAQALMEAKSMGAIQSLEAPMDVDRK